MSWTKLGAKKTREAMGRETEYDFDHADIARQVANEITVRTLEQGIDMRKEGKKCPRVPKKPMPPLVPTPELAGLPTTGNPKDDESLIPPKGIPGEVAFGIRYNTNEFFPDFNIQRTWDSGKLNIRDKCSNVFLKKNWEAWRKLAKPPCGNPPKAEMRKSFLHYAGLELHGVVTLDGEDFLVEKIPGAAVALTPDDDGPDYESSLSERQRLKIQSDLLAMAAEPQRMTRSTRTRLEYEPMLLSTSPPTKHDIMGGTSDTSTPSPPSSILIDLTNDGLHGSSSPPPSQIVPTNKFVDLAQYISSPENNGSKDQGWPSKEDLTKEDLQSGLLPGKHLQEDVIIVYIKKRFIDRGIKKLFNMFFVNTFWFPNASELVDRYDRTSHSEEAMISIARLRRSITPKLHDGDSQGQLPAWIFIPIHGRNHWSLAIIRLHLQYCHIVHLDSCVDIHVPTAIFHVLKTFVSLTMKMLCGAGMREEQLDRCFWQERLRTIATTDQVNSFWIMLGLYLEGKLKVPPT
ncbi:hypothetical protein R1sor_013101 [Riccia sorocarpa]|uniref:Ubiquitin-like protease family profile domain-containing protein n=1 Tax=Riccia sorocarpa TaxID=122646 RepID=A0ABD3H5J0_9MARC